MNVLGLNGLKCLKVSKLFLNLLFPLLHLLQVSRDLPLVSLLYLHDYLLASLGGQLKQDFGFESPDHEPLLEDQVKLLHVRIPCEIDPEHVLLGTAITVAEIFEVTEDVRSQDFQQVVNFIRPCKQGGTCQQ